jgi:2-polyprenyl-6-methoxyphenol hydroxylase-like FAD-dependent oxidoreductase
MQTTLSSNSTRRRALIIGGSLGGLFAGTMLRSIGWDVDIYERSEHDLDSRGGGIVLQPDVVEVFRRAGLRLNRDEMGVRSGYRTVFRPDGSTQSKQFLPQTQTSWSLIYSTLKEAFGDARYHSGKRLARIEQDTEAGSVTAFFSDGTAETGDLLIGADGGNSTVRSLIWPQVQPSYAGYLAWRGLVPEEDMPPSARADLHGDFGFGNNKGSHILGYLVPGEGNDMRPGHRFYNWVWYRVANDDQLQQIMTDRDGLQRGYSIPEGKLADAWIKHLRADAANLLPPPFRDIVEATEQPFAQAIRDLASDEMVKSRVLILGDAASIPRPHTAASTSKAAANAIALADELAASPSDIADALTRWELPQVMYGKYLEKQGTEAGNYLLFHNPPDSAVG